MHGMPADHARILLVGFHYCGSGMASSTYDVFFCRSSFCSVFSSVRSFISAWFSGVVTVLVLLVKLIVLVLGSVLVLGQLPKLPCCKVL